MSNFKDYRVDNPVIVDCLYTHIRSIPSENDKSYTVYGNGNALTNEDITPIPMDENVFRSFKDFINMGSLVFESKGHKIAIDAPTYYCYYDKEPIGTIEYLHELYNILEDYLNGYHLTYYLPAIIQEND